MTDFAILMSSIVALLTVLGAGVAWVAARMTSQTARFDRMEQRYNTLHRDHALVLVQVERFRLALQIAVAAISRRNPDDPALVHIQALLADQFMFPSDRQASTPEDFKETLRDLDRPEEAGPRPRRRRAAK